MVDIEIDVYRAGVLQGSGPLYEVTGLSADGRTNEAASWSFMTQLRAGSPAMYLTEESECFGYLVGAAGRVPLFGGRIAQATPQAGETGAMISVSGAGLLGELAYDYFESLELSESVTRPPRGARTLTSAGEIDVPEWFDGDTGTSETATLSKIDWIYIYDPSRFFEIELDVLTANGQASGIEVQVYTAALQSNGKKGWEGVNRLTDEWSGSGVPFAQVGTQTLTFDLVGTWDEVILDGKQGYYFRFRPVDDTISFALRGITVTVKGPNTTDDFQQVVDRSFRFGMKTGSLIASANGYYGFLNDMSILAAMRRVTEGSNDIFRLGAADVREIELIRGDEPTVSGLRAAGPLNITSLGDLADGMLAIVGKPRKIQDFRKKVNKLFIYGNGSGHGSHYTLADHTFGEGGGSPAVGITINREESSITYEAGFALSPLVASKRYRDIQTLDGNIQGPEVSNQLVRLGVAELVQRMSGVEHHEIDVVGFKNRLLWPGDSLTVDYAEYDSGVELLRIDGELMVTAVRYQLSDGVLQGSVTVSSVPRFPMDERDFLLGELETARRTDTNEQRLRGFALFGPRVPVEGDAGSVISDPDEKPFGGTICVPSDIFADEFRPITAEFLTWLNEGNDAGAGARYGYAHPGTGDSNDYDWIWISDGNGEATVDRNRDI